MDYNDAPIPDSDPCDSCPNAETCDQICLARARWWDHKIRGVKQDKPKPKPPAKSHVMGDIYIVRQRDGTQLAIGEAWKCAKILGITQSAFYGRFYRYRDKPDVGPWTIDRIDHVKPDHPAGKPVGSSTRRYTVYRNGTDEPVAIHATSREAAAAMGITISSFYSAVYRAKTGENARWHVEREEVDDYDVKTDDP